MYGNLPPLVINKYVDGLKVFAKYILTIGTAFSGIEIAGVGVDSIRYASLFLWGVGLKFHYAFMCENDPQKQQFLLNTNPLAEMLINNSKELVNTFTRNVRDNIRMAVPGAFSFIAGFMCCDKSPNNNNRVALKGSMQRGEGKTSDTFEDAMAYIRRMLPTIVILENLKELLTPVIDGAHLSDATYVVQQLMIVGYAIGLPGMVSMKDAARVYGLGTRGKAAISKRVKAYAEKYGLPPSNYMKSAEACATYRSTNQTKRKQ